MDETTTEPTAESTTEQVTTEAAQPEQTQAEQIAEAKYKLKVYGKEQEVPVSELIRMASLAEGAEVKMRKAAEAIKKAEQERGEFIERLKTDPLAAKELLSGSVTMKQLAEEYFLEQSREAALTDEQKKIREIERERDELRERYKHIEQEKKIAESERAAVALYNELETVIDGNPALKGIGKPFVMRRFHHYIDMAWAESQRDPSFKIGMEDLVALVEDDLGQGTASHVSALDDDKLIAMLGEERIGRIIKSRLKTDEPVKEKEKESKQKRAMLASEYFESIRNGD